MYEESPRQTRRPRRRSGGHWLAFAAAGAFVAAALPRTVTVPEPPAPVEPERTASLPTAAVRPSAEIAWMLDRTPVLGSNARALAENAPRSAELVPPPVAPAPMVVAALLAEPAPSRAEPPTRVVQSVPLPMARPAELRRPSDPVRLAERPLPPRARIAAARTVEAERSFFETVFGVKPERGPALAYASPGTDPSETPAGKPLAPFSAPSAGAGVAVYDISARTVTLPSGERLEAHSGLGASMDNPLYVHLRMRGATPPGTYDLTEREAMFHGVRAIRLNPVGGASAVHGRTGLLAHTYMLRGQPGASNGCVVFRDYNRFLQAYLRGDVRRLVVVAGNGSDRIAGLGERLFGRARREARAGE